MWGNWERLVGGSNEMPCILERVSCLHAVVHPRQLGDQGGGWSGQSDDTAGGRAWGAYLNKRKTPSQRELHGLSLRRPSIALMAIRMAQDRWRSVTGRLGDRLMCAQDNTYSYRR